MKLSTVVAAAFLVSAGMTLPVHAQEKAKAKAAQKGGGDMTFFVTSVGKGSGADLDGLEGADAHCNALAKAAGSKRTNWKAYLSATAPGGELGVNARERIGKGPREGGNGQRARRFPERARHSHRLGFGGMYSTAAGDTTCGNWTKSGEGSAIVGLFYCFAPN